MITNIPYLGEVLSLIVALAWAFAVILFKKSGEKVHPIALNLFKALLASVLLLPTLWLLSGTLTPQIHRTDYWLLLLSGALGLGISDTLFFISLNKLGAGSIFIFIFAALLLKEPINPQRIFGIVLAVFGAFLVMLG